MTSAASADPARAHLSLVPDVPRPLPRQVRPLQDEVLSSYISRLAAANHLPFGVLLDLLCRRAGAGHDPLAHLRWLAAVTGLDPVTALMALPELRTGRPGTGGPLPLAGRPVPHLARHAQPCRGCAAAHGVDLDIGAQVWVSVENNVCRTHQLWTGPGASGYDRQLSLRAHPDITAAQARHTRLIRRHGRREAFSAFLDAREIWTTLEWVHGYTAERDQRVRRHPGRAVHPDELDYGEPLHHAAVYPETVALAAILASPYWRKIALARAPDDREPFHAEFARRVTPHHQQPALLLRLVRERLTDPGRKHRTSDLHDPPRSATPRAAGIAPTASLDTTSNETASRPASHLNCNTA